MDGKTTSVIHWQPQSQNWGDAAYEETKSQFIHTVLATETPRAQAFAIWALGQEPSLSDQEISSLAGTGADVPTTEHVAAARRVLGLGGSGNAERATKRSKKSKRASSRKSKPSLSGLEKAILADFQATSKLVHDYKTTVAAMEAARQAVEAARTALAEIDPVKAQLIAQHDEDLRAVLAELGLL